MFRLVVFLAVLIFGVTTASGVLAQMSSSNYQINADVLSGGGNLSSSTNYSTDDTIGEGAVGVGSSTNYVLKDGFWQMVNTYLHFSIDSNLVNFGALTPGTPVTGQNTLSVTTDAWNGYTITIVKNNRLRHTDASTEIADHAGTIAVPLAWSTPSNIGLGVTLTSGTGADTKWASGTKYAAIPTAVASTIHTKTGYKSPADTTVTGYKLDVPSTQKSGFYTADVTYTIIPSL